ncbi:hypothetical protein [Yinghuangia seranimata]|uniref:hypothetical protein n=1 Tax=Yinghuangia seranimata TaxID=408067 RepID=UPI00248BDFE6|nr:hypothetical protein [Yinghuangia seranimata]MDI2132037.1 hypothetical protein [Yinghuangia seranimata]
MRERFEQGMRDVPDTLAPHQAIEGGGRRLRRRRTAIAGSIAAVLVAAGGLTAVSLATGGGGGQKTAAAGSPPLAVAQSPAATPAPESTPSTPKTQPDGLGKVTVASGDFKGHKWELVRTRSTGMYQQPSPDDKSKLVEATGYCELYEVFLDGHLDNRAGNACAPDPLWDRPVTDDHAGFSNVGVGDTALYKPGVGKLGAVTFGRMSPNVAKVTATFEDGTKADAKVLTVPGTSEHYYVFEVPEGSRPDGAASAKWFDAGGKVLSQEDNLGIVGGK